MKPALVILMLIMIELSYSSSFAEEPLNEFECLHLNIGLLSLLVTDNTYFQRKQKQASAAQGSIAQGLTLLKSRGEFCVIKQQLYVEAAEYSLHQGSLDDAAYFLKQARSLSGPGALSKSRE